MNDIFDLFLITGDDKDHRNLIDIAKSSVKENKILFFNDDDLCLSVINSFKPGVKFRLWIHAGIKAFPDPAQINLTGIRGLIDAKKFEDNKFYYNLITSTVSEDAIKRYNEKVTESGKFKTFGKIYDISVVLYQGLNPEEVKINLINEKNIIKEITKVSNLLDEVKIDIVVINAIIDEQKPLLEIFNEKIESNLKVSSKSKLSIRTIKNKNGISKNIGFLTQDRMGMVDAAILSVQAIEICKPKILVMTGVCGGEYSSNYGDVIIPKQSFTGLTP